MLLPDWIVFYLAIAGGGAIILGHRRLGIGLLIPAFLRWLVFPLLAPQLHFLPWPLVVVALPVIGVFGGLLVLDKIMSFVYGPRAGGHVTGTYLVRVLDAIALGTLWLVTLPFRLVNQFFNNH